MTTSSKFFKASFCNTLDPSAVEVLSPEQKAKQRGSLSINEGYFSDIFNVQQSSYSSFTTKSIICEDLPDREIGGLIEDVAIQGRDTKSNISGERQEPEATIALISLPLYVLFSAGAGPVPWLLYNEVFPLESAPKRCLCAPPPTTSPTPSSVLRFYPASRSSVWAARTPVTRS